MRLNFVRKFAFVLSTLVLLSFASAQTTEEVCTPKDLSERLGGVRNQGQIGWMKDCSRRHARLMMAMATLGNCREVI